VTGAIDPTRVLTNGGAKPGDALILTKPLGTGVVGTAIKFNRAAAPLVEQAVAAMRTLNRAAAEALASIDSVHSCTDVTGFGLIGHGTEMAEASGVTLAIRAADVPVFEGVLHIVRRNHSGGMDSNRTYYSGGVDTAKTVPGEVEDLLYDPQTSGGLLIALDQLEADRALQTLADAGVMAWRIGAVTPRGTRAIVVR
jgi:selenide,water dikinase